MYRKKQKTPQTIDSEEINDWQLNNSDFSNSFGLRSAETEVLESISDEKIKHYCLCLNQLVILLILRVILMKYLIS